MSYEHCDKHDEPATNGCASCLKERQAKCEHHWKCTECDREAPRLQTLKDCVRAADRLLAAYLEKNETAYPSSTSTLELMTWAHAQAGENLSAELLLEPIFVFTEDDAAPSFTSFVGDRSWDTRINRRRTYEFIRKMDAKLGDLAERIEEQALLLSDEGACGYSDILQVIVNDLRALGRR